MATNRFLTLTNGQVQQVTAISSSAGPTDANKAIATGSDGKISPTLMPSGLGAPTISIVASEALAAGDFVNLTPAGARKADSANSRHAMGFVLAAVASGQNATVYLSGQNTSLSSLTIGTRYYLGASGVPTPTAPTTVGSVVQFLGSAIATNTINFEEDNYIVIA